MSHHRISDDGSSIVCTAPEDAWCRTVPDCDAEGWGDRGCNVHDPGHPRTPGHDCWAVVWVNDSNYLEDTCDDPDAEIFPGSSVALTWHGDEIGIGWAYTNPPKETPDD